MGRDLDLISQPRELPTTMVQYLERMRPEIARGLPKGMDPDRMVRIALTQLRLNEDLQRCDPNSFAAAMLTSTALGLEPGVLDEAYLIPYGRECTFVVGYKGYVKLFWQHPKAQHIDAQIIRKGDEFDYAKGLDPYLIHKPGLDNEDAEWTHAYAVASLTTGARTFEVLTRKQVKELRKGKEGPDRRFKGGDPMHWMERKTAVRQMMKLLPKSTMLAAAVNVDEVNGSELRAHQIPQRIYDNEPIGELTGDRSGPLAIDTPEAVNESTGEVYVSSDQVPQQEPEGWK